MLVVGGLIVAAALGGAFLATRSTGTPTTPVKPTTTVAPTGDDSGIGEAVFEAPSVVAEAQPGAVRFTWNYVQPSPKDTFQVKLGPTASRGDRGLADHPLDPPLRRPRRCRHARVCGRDGRPQRPDEPGVPRRLCDRPIGPAGRDKHDIPALVTQGMDSA
ncbi:MAG: hypothetical protein V9F04_04975 [Dermatophilaceae bacterium]